MKMFIKNETIIKYKIIGELFDEYYKKNKINLYEGKYDVIVIRKNKKEYKLEIKVTKTRINLYVEELDLEPKKVDMSDKTFPEIPKRRKEKINERKNN